MGNTQALNTVCVTGNTVHGLGSWQVSQQIALQPISVHCLRHNSEVLLALWADI